MSGGDLRSLASSLSSVYTRAFTSRLPVRASRLASMWIFVVTELNLLHGCLEDRVHPLKQWWILGLRLLVVLAGLRLVLVSTRDHSVHGLAMWQYPYFYKIMTMMEFP